MRVFIARITYQEGGKVVKKEAGQYDLYYLLKLLQEIYGNEVLEIHITRGEK